MYLKIYLRCCNRRSMYAVNLRFLVPLQQKLVLQLNMFDEKGRSKAMKTVVGAEGTHKFLPHDSLLLTRE